MANGTKRYLAAAIVAATTLAMTGCGASGETESSGDSVTIEIWNPETDESVLDWFETHVPEFEEQNPGVKVEIVSIPWADIYPRWQSAIQAGDPPDATIGSAAFAASFNAQGVVEPVDDVVEALGGEEIWAETAGSFVEMNKADGSYFALPFVHNSVVLWYNKAMLEEAGVEPPSTWEELEEAAAAMTEGDRYGILVPSSASQVTQQGLYSLILSNGGDLVDRENPEEVIFDSPEVAEALDFYERLSQYSPPGSGGYDRPEAQAAMTTGRLGMFIYGSWMGGALEQAGEDVFNQFGVTSVPANGGSGAFMGGLSLFRFTGSEHPEETNAFLQFMLEKENYEDWVVRNPSSFLPVTKAVQESETYLNHERVALHRPVIDAAFQSLPTAWVYGMPNPHAGEFEGLNIISEAASKVILNGVAPEQAAAEAAEQMRDIIGE